MKLATLRERHARRPAGRRQPRPHARAAGAARSRRPCRPRSTTGRGSRRALEQVAHRPRGRPRAGQLPVRADAGAGAAAARLPLGGRLGLRQPRRARAQGARRRDAAELLDRSAGLPGRLRRLPRRRRPTCRCRARTAASTSRPRSPWSPTTCRWARRPARGARATSSCVMLVNDWSLRNLIPAELAKGFGFYQSKPATSFSPVRGHARRARRRLGRRQGRTCRWCRT